MKIINKYIGLDRVIEKRRSLLRSELANIVAIKPADYDVLEITEDNIKRIFELPIIN